MEKKITTKKKTTKVSKGLTAPDKLKILFTIVDRSKTEYYIDILEHFEINLQCVMFGRGTAPKHLRHLGLGDEGKAIIISVVKEEKLKDLFHTLTDCFQKTKNGKGIAYTIPITSVIGVMVYQFLSNNHEQIRKGA